MEDAPEGGPVEAIVIGGSHDEVVEESPEEFNHTQEGDPEVVKTRRKKRSTVQVLQDDIEKLEADIMKIEEVVEPLENEEPTHARVLERIAKKRKTLEVKAALLAAKKRQVAVEEEKGKVLISPKIGTYFPHCISSISDVLARISTNTRPYFRTCIRGCISVF